jgi:SH3 domain-containing protein
MKYKTLILTLTILALGHASSLLAQSDEVKLDLVQAKITTVSAMRMRKGPQVTADEVARLKLGTVINAIARSTNQDTIAGKTDYWYRINLANGVTGWVFGGLLLDYNVSQHQEILRQIIEARLQAENTDFSDRHEIYNLAARSLTEAKDENSRAEFELLKLLALRKTAEAFPNNLSDKSPYREWIKAHASEVVENEFAGSYNMRADVLWNLESKYRRLPIADRIAWEASQTLPPSDCEGDEVCDFFLYDGEIKYLSLHPTGAHASEALKNLSEALSDELIREANEKGGDKYVIEQRTELRKLLASLRLAVSKTSGSEAARVLKKLDEIK